RVRLNISKKVITPTRPINIRIINITLLGTDNSLVIPSERPTVPNAEVTSNNISVKLNPSNIETTITDKNIKKNAINVTVTALIKSSLCISRLKILILFLPRAKVIKNINTIAKVVVLILPPALLGDAPINIKPDINKSEERREAKKGIHLYR